MRRAGRLRTAAFTGASGEAASAYASGDSRLAFLQRRTYSSPFARLDCRDRRARKPGRYSRARGAVAAVGVRWSSVGPLSCGRLPVPAVEEAGPGPVRIGALAFRSGVAAGRHAPA